MKARKFFHGLGIFLRGKAAVRQQLTASYEKTKDNAVSLKTAKGVEMASIQEQIHELKERKALLMTQMAELQAEWDTTDNDEIKLKKIYKQLKKEFAHLEYHAEAEEGMVDLLTKIDGAIAEEDGMLRLVNLSKAELHQEVGVSMIAHLMWMETIEMRKFADALVIGGVNHRQYVLDTGYMIHTSHGNRYELMTDIAYALELVQTEADEAEEMKMAINESIAAAGNKREREEEEEEDDDDDDNGKPAAKKPFVGAEE